MPIIVTGGASFDPHPPGQFAAVCIDVIDRGMVETTYEGKTSKKWKIVVRFFCGEHRPDGDLQWVGRSFTATLDPRGNLVGFLEAWRGRQFTDQEREGFDLERLIGVPALLQIQHTTGDPVYANIVSVMQLPKGSPAPTIPSSYVRVEDREPEQPAAPQGQPDMPPGPDPDHYDTF